MKYIEGDLFDHLGTGPVLVPHIVNTKRVWGAGFVVPLGIKFPAAREVYMHAASLSLGDVQYASEGDVTICNMVAQAGVGSHKGVPPIRYGALSDCMKKIRDKAWQTARIVSPAFGSGLAKGRWEVIESLINEWWDGIDVTICYLPGAKP